MNLSRRSMMKGLLAFFMAGFTPSTTTATTAAAKPQSPELLLNRFFIAGFQFYDDPALSAGLAAAHPCHSGPSLKMNTTPLPWKFSWAIPNSDTFPARTTSTSAA